MPQLNRISVTQSISFLKSTPDISHNEDDHYIQQSYFWISFHKSQHYRTDSRGWWKWAWCKDNPFRWHSLTSASVLLHLLLEGVAFLGRHTRFDWQVDVTLWNCFWLTMTAAEKKNKNSGWCIEHSARSSWGLIRRSNSHIKLKA